MTTKKSPPKWISAAKLGKYFAITTKAAKDVLKANHLVDDSYEPTKLALDGGYAELRENEYEGKDFYTVWCFANVSQFFKAPTERQEAAYFKNRYDAEDKVMEAILTLGKLVGVDCDICESEGHVKVPENLKLKPESISALTQCYWNDPHFMGVAAIHYATSKADCDKIYSGVWPVVNDLVANLPKAKHKAAEIPVFTVQASEKWLRTVVKKTGNRL